MLVLHTIGDSTTLMCNTHTLLVAHIGGIHTSVTHTLLVTHFGGTPPRPSDDENDSMGLTIVRACASGCNCDNAPKGLTILDTYASGCKCDNIKINNRRQKGLTNLDTHASGCKCAPVCDATPPPLLLAL